MIYHKVKLAAVVFAIIVYKFAKLLHCLLLKSDRIRLEMTKRSTAHHLKPDARDKKYGKKNGKPFSWFNE